MRKSAVVSRRCSVARLLRVVGPFQVFGTAVALNYFAYNFIKIHSTLRTSPTMAAGVTTRLWDVADLVDLLIASESKKAA